jgi:hypothetical protein
MSLEDSMDNNFTFHYDQAVLLIEENMDKPLKKIRAILVLEDIPGKIAEAAIKAAKEKGDLPENARAGGFAAGFYDFLSDAHQTDGAILEYLMAAEGTNVMRNEKHYLKIAAVVNAMWNKVESA